GAIVDVGDGDVYLAVVVEVAERGAAPRLRRRQGWTEFLSDVGEVSLAVVVVDDLPLLVAGLGLELPHFGVDVAVDQEEIEPSVVIEIDERRAPAEPARVHADARGERPVVAQAAAAVLVERRREHALARLED